jgi:hypothetical protein
MAKRIFYAIEQLGFAKDGLNTYIPAHGVQSCGITTTFNLEQVFELGQIAIYQNVENIPDIQVTAEKALDGYPLLYHLATNGAPSPSLTGRSTVKTTVALSVFQDTQDSASGTPLAEVHMSGMFISSLNYNFGVDGVSTEAVTLVGQSKVWRDVQNGDPALFSGVFNNADQPFAINGSGGTQHRWDILFEPVTGPGSPPSPALDVNGQTNQWCTVLPTDIYGMSSSGTNPRAADGTYVVPIQSIAISTDLGRDSIFELGRKSFYHRFVTFPVEVRTDIEVLSTKFDNISGDETGGHNGAPVGSNLKSQSIRVRMRDGTMVDTGKQNKLQSVAYQGGDAGTGGGNVTLRYSYLSYNELTVTHPQDPSGL